MNKRVLLLVLASLMSNFVRRNFVNYSCIGPHYEAWIGSSAFSAGVAVVCASIAAIRHREDDTPVAVLYTYYTAMSLLVSILVLKLVWIPVVDLVTEVNQILSKTALYLNRTVWPRTKNSFMKDIGVFLGTRTAVVWSTNLLGILFLYSVSTDILNHFALYFYTLPRKGILANIRSAALKAIDTMLCMVGPKKHVRFHWDSEVKYYSLGSNQQDINLCFEDNDEEEENVIHI